MGLRTLARWLLDPWLILGAFGFGILLLVASLSLLWLTRSGPSVAGLPTAIVTVITLPTETPVTPSPSPTNPATPSPSQLPLPPPGDVSIEAYVQITGTGGDGLRLRTEPGLNSEVRMLGAEAEVFIVKDGPRQVDDYTWWYVVGPFDPMRRGWAVANYLAVVQNP